MGIEPGTVRLGVEQNNVFREEPLLGSGRFGLYEVVWFRFHIHISALCACLYFHAGGSLPRSPTLLSLQTVASSLHSVVLYVSIGLR